MWLESLSDKEQSQVKARLNRILVHNHFGDAKILGGGLSELKWKNGRRIYFSIIERKIILLLIGGNKNGQDKDIKNARFLIGKYTQFET